jgi:hypothetical protein
MLFSLLSMKEGSDNVILIGNEHQNSSMKSSYSYLFRSSRPKMCFLNRILLFPFV